MQALRDCFGLLFSLVGMIIRAEWFPGFVLGCLVTVGPLALVKLWHGQDAIAAEQRSDTECVARVRTAGYSNEANMMEAMNGADAYEETGQLAFKVAPPVYKVATIAITKDALPESEVQIKKAEADMGLNALKLKYCSDLFPES